MAPADLAPLILRPTMIYGHAKVVAETALVRGERWPPVLLSLTTVAPA